MSVVIAVINKSQNHIARFAFKPAFGLEYPGFIDVAFNSLHCRGIQHPGILKPQFAWHKRFNILFCIGMLIHRP